MIKDVDEPVKEIIAYTVSSWQRMMLNILDGIILSIIGIEALQIGGLSLILVISINVFTLSLIRTFIAYNSLTLNYFYSLSYFRFNIILINAFVYLLMAIIAKIFIDSDIEYFVSVYLFLYIPLSSIIINNIIIRELLLYEKQSRFVISLGHRSLYIYSISNILLFFTLTVFEFECYPHFLLFGGYITSLYNYFELTNKSLTIMSILKAKDKPLLNSKSLYVCIYAALNDSLDIIYVVVLSWIAIILSPTFSAVIYLSYLLAEFSSAFPIALSRYYIKNKKFLNKNQEKAAPYSITKIYISYISVICIVYILILYLYFNARYAFIIPFIFFIVVSFDGVQIILRGILTGKGLSKFSAYVSVSVYTLSLLLIFGSLILGSNKIFICAILFPFVMNSFAFYCRLLSAQDSYLKW